MKLVIDIPNKYFTEDLVNVVLCIHGKPDVKILGKANYTDNGIQVIGDLNFYLLAVGDYEKLKKQLDCFKDKTIKADHIESPCVDDQTIKSDDGKLKLSLVPREIIRAIARARMYGLKKYGDKESWKSVSKERYIDALYRHFLTYLDDIGGVDEESGLLHTDHMAFNIAAICELEKKERENE